MNYLTIDTETYYDKDVTVRKQGAGMYAAHPQCDVYLMSAADGENTWVGHPRDFNFDVLDNYDALAAYNVLFDEGVLSIGLPKMGIPFPSWKHAWVDASDMGSYLFGTTNLNATIKKAYGQTLDKAARSSMSGKTFDDVKPEMRERFLEYARRDAWWTHKLLVDHIHQWPAWEQKISYMTRTSSRKGIKVNTELLAQYLEAAQQELYEVEQTLPWVDDGEKPTSTKAIAYQCRKSGIPTPPVKDRDEEGYNKWEREYAPKHPWILTVGRWRSVNKVLGQLQTINARIRPDGTMESPTRYFGACSTGRWSGDGGFNFQNIRKAPIRCGDVEIDMRKLFMPRDGMKMFVADLAQIEPRVLNWYIGNEEMLSMMRAGMSPYQAFAVANLGWKGGDLKTEDPKQYAMVKVMVLGLGYGAGAERFVGMADSLSGGQVKLTLEESQATVDKFRSSAPLLCDKEKGMWATLDREFKKAAETDKHFEFELPSGRVVRYPNIVKTIRSYPEQKEIKKLVNGEIITEIKNVPKKKRVYLVEVDGRRKNVYGGLITENVTQAAARDVFGLCFENLFDNGLHVPFTVHDEAVIEAPADTKAKDIEEMMAVKPEWMPGLPVASEVNEVPHYLK
jgi:DNA polymerase